MSSFDFLWKMLDEHGVIERYKGDCFDLWNTLTLDQQRATYRSIRDKIRAGQFVNYHPVKAVRDNMPKTPKYSIMSYNEYVGKYHTTRKRTAGAACINLKSKERSLLNRKIEHF
jgi:hypothetical protein